MNTIAAIAITLGKAQLPEFKTYARQVLVNAKTLANRLMSGGARLVTNGTDNHMMVVNTVASFQVGGRDAEKTLDSVSITCNKQVIPDDPQPPLNPSGIRLGTPCATTRGMKEKEMEILGDWMIKALKHHQDKSVLNGIKSEVEAFCESFPLPGL
jgi:glycine hydroxymethyltransferase